MRYANWMVALVMGVIAGCSGLTDPFDGPGGPTEWVAGRGPHEVAWSVSSGALPSDVQDFFDGGDVVFEVRGIIAPTIVGTYRKGEPMTVSAEIGLAAKWATFWSVSIYGVELSPWMLRVNDQTPEGVSLVASREWASFMLEFDEVDEPTVVEWVGNSVAEFGVFEVWADSVTTVPEFEDCESPNPFRGHDGMFLWTSYARRVGNDVVPIEVPMKFLDGRWTAFVTYRAGLMRVVPRDGWYQQYMLGCFARPVGRANEQELWHASREPDLFGNWAFLEANVTPTSVEVEAPNTCGFVE